MIVMEGPLFRWPVEFQPILWEEMNSENASESPIAEFLWKCKKQEQKLHSVENWRGVGSGEGRKERLKEW